MKNLIPVFAAFLSVCGGPAHAQQILQPDQRVEGTLPAGGVHCYVLHTTPGSQWRLVADSPPFAGLHKTLEVGRGSCDQFTVDRSDNTVGSFTYTAGIDFAAGGGAYLVRVQPWPGFTGAYRLRAEPRGGAATANLLPAGEPIGPWLAAGWTPASVSASPARNGEGLRPRTVFKDCEDVCPELVVTAAGSFTMGSPDSETGRTAQEGPRHPVAFGSAFAIGRHEVTFAEYDACVDAGGCSHRPNDQGWGRGRRPVVDVSWNDAMAYTTWLSERTGQRYTLPSESEWEYAARAGTDTPWHTGRAILTDDANILNAFTRTVPVGSYPPNAFGLHDVHGNVWEWVLDCLDTGYVGAPNDGAAATGGACAASRMIRGGSFAHEPQHVRSAARSASAQSDRHPRIGFRVARAL